jgi:hypothetical protein
LTNSQAQAYAVIALENLKSEKVAITEENLYIEMYYLFDLYTEEAIEKLCYPF